jgi:hypothetical protein
MTTENTNQEILKPAPVQKICLAHFTAMNREATEYFLDKDDKAIKISLGVRFPTHVLHSITEYSVIKTDLREFDPPFDPGVGSSEQYLKKD